MISLSIVNLFYFEMVLRNLDYVNVCSILMICHSFCLFEKYIVYLLKVWKKYSMLVSADALILSFSLTFSRHFWCD